jgi:hypothetical protein
VPALRPLRRTLPDSGVGYAKILVQRHEGWECEVRVQRERYAAMNDKLVGKRIWLDYFDQNDKFAKAFTPQTCIVLRRMASVNWGDDWYLVALSQSFVYENVKYGNLLIRSRWLGCEIGVEDGTSVFIILVPDIEQLVSPFPIDREMYAAWGMAFPGDSVKGRAFTKERQESDRITESIRNILLLDWDPLGVNQPAPQDEYDIYIGGIYRLLSASASKAELAEYLRQLEITQLETVTNQEHRDMVAEKLKQLDVPV